MVQKIKIALFSFCLIMYMLSVNGNGVIYNCKPGEVFQDLCNTCVCNPDGINAACTRRSCSDYDLISCTPGEIVRSKCNYCMCSEEGKVTGCTRMACNYIA